MPLPRLLQRPPPRRLAAVALGGLLLAGCAHHVPLAETHRNGLVNQRVIHVVHYAAPAPAFKPVDKANPPAPAALKRGLNADPAAQVSQGLARLIGRKQRLRNLKTEARPLSPPVPKDVGAHRERFRQGLVLETWVDRWGIAPARGGDGGYVLSLEARSRLARVDDGQVLWLSRPCRVGNDSHNTGLEARDLASERRLRAAANAARDECVRQLARDFYAADGSGKN